MWYNITTEWCSGWNDLKFGQDVLKVSSYLKINNFFSKIFFQNFFGFFPKKIFYKNFPLQNFFFINKLFSKKKFPKQKFFTKKFFFQKKNFFPKIIFSQTDFFPKIIFFLKFMILERKIWKGEFFLTVQIFVWRSWGMYFPCNVYLFITKTALFRSTFA